MQDSRKRRQLARHPRRHVVRLQVERLESRELLSELSGLVSVADTAVPLADARMTLFTPDLGVFREVRSDVAGEYRFTGVPGGSYRLGVAGRSYEYEEIPILVGDAPATQSFELEPESQPGRWSFIGDITPEILAGTGSATLLANGEEVFYCHNSNDPVIFNYRTGETRFPLGSGQPAAGHASALLGDGRVLLVGGGNGSNGSPVNADPDLLRQAKAYDPITDSWTYLADMNVPRWYPSIVPLPDERLLVFGGDVGTVPGQLNRTDTAEIYDPVMNTWMLVGSFDRPQDMPPGVMLYTGEVLKTWRDAELFSLQTNSWRPTSQMLQTRQGANTGAHSDHTTVLLADGRAAVFGIRPNGPDPAFTEIYDPASDTWSLGASPIALRQRPEAVMLPGGQVLAYGGEYTGSLPAPVALGRSDWTKVTDLYDPETDTWRRLADLNRFIHYHSVDSLLPDGRVINVAGAGDGGFAGDDTRVEAFEPPYMFRGVRPRIDSLSSTELVPGQSLSLDVSFTSSVTELALIGLRATTHWIDAGPGRYLPLDFQQQGSQIQVTVPTDPIKALSGWYMLFAMVDDIPSEARIVHIGAGEAIPSTPPTIGDVTDQTIDEDTATATLAVPVSDAETPAASLTLSARSSNLALVPNDRIVLGGSGLNRTARVTPLANQFGAAVITVTVRDGDGATSSDSFLLTVRPVNDPPMAQAAARTTPAATPIDIDLSGLASDLETAADALTFSVASISGGTVSLLPDGRTARFTPAEAFTGPASFRYSVADAGAPVFSATATVSIVVEPDLPRLDIADAAVAEGDRGKQRVNFVVTLSQPLTQTVRARYRTIADTATSSRDFRARSGKLRFSPGQTELTISISVVGDLREEPDESFTVVLYRARQASIGDDAAIGTILDDDPASRSRQAPVGHTASIIVSAQSFETLPDRESEAPDEFVKWRDLLGRRFDVSGAMKRRAGRSLTDS